MDIIHYVFFQRALIAGVLAALACGIDRGLCRGETLCVPG